MRKFYLALLALLFQVIALGQTNTQIGSGTANNTGTSYPCPLQDYYEGSRAQYLYLASEMSAAGMVPGTISALSFNVLNLNTFSGAIEQMTISIGTTTVSALTNNSWETVSTVVVGPVDYTPQLGLNTFTLATPLSWNGSDNIVIEICNGDPNNSGGTTYTQNVSVDWTTAIGFNGSHTYRADNLGNLCGTTTTTNSGTQTTRPNITFTWSPASTSGCFVPTGTTFANITSTGADVSWTAPAVGSPAAGYNWELRTSGAGGSGSTGLVTSGTTTTTSGSITGLSSNTSYSFYIQTNCGAGGQSIWAGPFTLTTACGVVTTFFENFDAVTVPALPSCWATVGTLGTVNTQAANPNSTPNTLYMLGSATGQPVVSMPPVSNASNNTHQLKFNLRANFTVGGIVQVGYLTDPVDPATFVSIQDVTAATLTYQSYVVVPGSIGTVGTPTYLAFRHSGTPATSLLIDDVSWEPIPSCVEPNTLLVSGIGITTAQLDWTAPATSSPQSYDIYVSTTNTTPTGTTTPTATGVTSTTYNITGLTGATTYYVWVRSNCGTGSGVSVWSAVVTFATNCIATNVPYTLDFESATTPGLPVCTSVENVGTGNNWATSSAPGSGFTSKTLQYSYSSANPADAWFYTQGLNLTGGVSYRLKFRYGNNSTTYIESMNVSFGDAASSTAMSNLIVDYPSITGSAAISSSSDFTPSTTGVYYIGFHAYSIANQFNLFVDDISVDVTPVCNEPVSVVHSSVTATAAQIDWTAPSVGAPASYEVYVSTSNTPPNSTTTPTASGITSTTYNATGLTPATTYFVWVRSNCGTGGVSAWSVADSFATSCNATNVPYTLDFESVTVPGLPICTSTENVGAGNNWNTANNPGNGFTTNTLQYLYNFTNPADAWFYTQGLNLTAGVSYRLKFNYGNNSTTYIESMNVSYGDAASSTAMTNLIVDYPSITGGTLTASSTDFTPSTTGVYYIGFHVYSIANQYNLYVDDINVTVSPLCSEPSALIASSVTASGVQIDWTAPTTGSPASYDVYISTSNTAPTSSTTPTASGITATTYTATGLSSATTYFVWVRSNCGTGGTSVWSSVVSFTTLCQPITSFYENFDGVTTPALPTCWAKVGISGTANTQATNANSAPNTMYIYGTSATNQAVVSMPPVSNAANNTHQIRFSARGNFTAGATIQVGYLTDPADAATFVSIQDVVTSTLTYQSFTVIPGAIGTAGTPTVFAFRHTGTPAYSVLIDDVYWEAIPSCVEPTAVVVANPTTSSAQIDWTAPTVGSPASYEVYISTSNTPPTGTTTPTATGITSTTYNATGLNGSTTYYVWVRSNCGTGGVSVWSLAATFATACTADSVPYVQDFESATTPSMPACTSTENVGNGNNWTTVNNPGNGFTSKTLRYAYNSTSPADAWFYTNGLTLQAGISYTLDFKYGNNSTTYIESMNVSYGTSASATDMTNPIIDYPTITGGAPATSSTTFTPTTSGVYYIGFHAYSIANQFNLYVDSISVRLTSTSPVTLVNFKGERQGARNILTWNTATEQRNKGFELQRSINGKDFTTVSFVSSQAVNGSSSSALNYSFVDEKPLGGDNYYRLKQVDFDGKSTLSNVVLIKGVRVNALVLSSVYPNPAKNQLNVVMSAPSNQRISLVVTDVTGKVVKQQAAQLVSGDNNLQVNVTELPSGTYMIKAVCSNGCETAISKFVKQ